MSSEPDRVLCKCLTLCLRKTVNLNGDIVSGCLVSRSTAHRHKKVDQRSAVLRAQEQAAGDISDAVLLRTIGAHQPPSQPAVHQEQLQPGSDSHPTHSHHQPLEEDHAMDTTDDFTDAAEDAVKILSHLSRAIDDEIAFFSQDTPLVFCTPPRPELEVYSPLEVVPSGANMGSQILDYRHPQNQNVVTHENRLFQYLSILQGYASPHEIPTLQDLHQRLLAKVQTQIFKVDAVKAEEWEGQCGRLGTADNLHPDPIPGVKRVDCKSYMSRRLDGFNPALTICYFLIATLSLLCRLSQKHCNFVLSSLKLVLRHVAGNTKTDDLRRSLPNDVRTIIQQFDLRPKLRTYISCPSCHALYPASGSKTKQHCSFVDCGIACGAELFTVKNIQGSQIEAPILTFAVQDMKEWLARLLSRPDIMKDLTRPRQSKEQKDGQCDDIMDAEILSNFTWPAPISSSTDELRLIFSMNIDGFNPFGSSNYTSTSSVCGIYMACLSLSPAIRYLPQNLYLVGIIPGPKKPSMAKINPYLSPVIDALLEFWDPGVHFSHTAIHPIGALVRAALIPLVCDLLAARQASGFLSHNATLFCSFCYLDLASIENFDQATWPLRDSDTHRSHALEWLHATSNAHRTRIEREHGARFSELHRLPYWDVVLFMVVELMHALYLRNVRELIWVTWGCSTEIQTSGDGQKPSLAPARPSWGDLAFVMQSLCDGTFHELAPRTYYACFWYICSEFGLRRAGGSKILFQRLQDWWAQYSAQEENVTHFKDTILCFKNKDEIRIGLIPYDEFKSQIPTPEELPTELDIRVAEKKVINSKTIPALGRDVRLPTLQYLCGARGLDVQGVDGKALTRKDLILKLHEWRVAAGLFDHTGVAQPRRKLPNVVLGLDMLEEVWKDQKRTVLPSFVTAAPLLSAQHRTPTADHWRSISCIHLVVTLGRMWGYEPEGGRKRAMLDNFMHLITALHIASSRTMDETLVKEYEFHYRSYLEGLVKLYPDGTIQPSHHLALHAGAHFRAFGPAHSWSAWAFERYNYLLQNTKTSGKFGQLEKTFIDTACSAANLRTLLASSSVPPELEELIPSFDIAFNSDTRGSRLQDIIHFTHQGQSKVELAPVKARGRQATVNRALHPFACQSVGVPMSEGVLFCTSLTKGGVVYRPSAVSHKDSNIILRGSRAASLLAIFQSRGEVWIVVKFYMELSPADVSNDPYRRYGFQVGGQLFNDVLENQVAITAHELVCLFAKTQYYHEILGRDVVHVLPMIKSILLANSENPADDVDTDPEL